MSQTAVFAGRTALGIAASIEQALASGKLSDGNRLPPIRELARSLRVSPVTVTAAYRLLRSRGLALGSGRRGTALRARAHLASAVAGASRHAPGLVDLATGNPDPAFLPAIGGALRGVDPDARLYGGTLELPALVSFAAAEFASDGIPGGSIAVTSGSLDAIERILREHARTGDQVAVEDPTFPGAPRSADVAGTGAGAFQHRR
jgi:DNA-binding transcriptional MocR family regulator